MNAESKLSTTKARPDAAPSRSNKRFPMTLLFEPPEEPDRRPARFRPNGRSDGSTALARALVGAQPSCRVGRWPLASFLQQVAVLVPVVEGAQQSAVLLGREATLGVRNDVVDLAVLGLPVAEGVLALAVADDDATPGGPEEEPCPLTYIDSVGR